MIVIRDYTTLKQTINPADTCSVLPFTRSYPLMPAHDYIYSFAVGKAQRLLGVMWDNAHDFAIWRGITNPSPTVWDEAAYLAWFQAKGFDYVFIPADNFMHKIYATTMSDTLVAQVDQIWIDNNYEDALSYFPLKKFSLEQTKNFNRSWLKLVFWRTLFMSSDITSSHFFNRTYQPFGPDGVNGYIYKHFTDRYVAEGTYEVVPALRNANGTVFDHFTDDYPQDAKDFIVSLVPYFNQFRSDQNFAALQASLLTFASTSGTFNLSFQWWEPRDPIVKDWAFCLFFLRNGVDIELENYTAWEYAYGF